MEAVDRTEGSQAQDGIISSRMAALASLIEYVTIARVKIRHFSDCGKQYYTLAQRVREAKEASEDNLRTVQLQKHHMQQQAVDLINASQYTSICTERIDMK